MSFDKIFDLTAGVYFNFYNIYSNISDVHNLISGVKAFAQVHFVIEEMYAQPSSQYKLFFFPTPGT